jgi:hypothetical protein
MEFEGKNAVTVNADAAKVTHTRCFIGEPIGELIVFMRKTRSLKDQCLPRICAEPVFNTYNSQTSTRLKYTIKIRSDLGERQISRQATHIKFKVAVTVAVIANRMHSWTSVVETCVSFGLVTNQNLTLRWLKYGAVKYS